jgi:hypothetical protein
MPSERVAACAGSGRELRNQHEGRGALASPVLLLTDREQADGGDGLKDGERDHAEERAAAVSRGKRRLDLSLEQQRRTKRECPSSIFLGVHPFWSADQLLYGFWVRHLGKDWSYGRFSDENQAAWARDYAAQKLIKLTHCRQLPMNPDQFFLDDDDIKAKIDKKVAEWVNKMRSTSEARSKSGYGVEITDSAQYRVRLRIGRKHVTFGTFSTEEMACLVSDYVCREFLSLPAMNRPATQLAGCDELKAKRARIYMAACSASESDKCFDRIKEEFWEAVQEGPVYICCSCHQTWFRKSVKEVTETLKTTVLRAGCMAAITDISRWVCGSCYR